MTGLRAASRAELRDLDRRAIDERGIPSAALMERAGAAVADEVRRLQPKAVVVFAGKGNNGGDGRIAARLLAPLPVRVIDVEAGGDFAIRPDETVVDAIFGIGLDREVTGSWRRAIEVINASGRPVVAVDIPSGLDCDTGKPLGAAVRAQVTMTFGLPKKGFDAPGASAFTGRVVLADIGYPADLIAPFRRLA